ncbi:hypothetical protein, partial [Nocardia cyriacigeorgica]|uniref:hypothetical protein n=1 Tax=Nocardia cyriacigeorgica TaxID=135487 RepID=UPI00245524E4
MSSGTSKVPTPGTVTGAAPPGGGGGKKRPEGAAPAGPGRKGRDIQTGLEAVKKWLEDWAEAGSISGDTI